MTPTARLLSLRVDLRDPDAAAEVTPEALAAYAERTGWTLATTYWPEPTGGVNVDFSNGTVS